MAQTLGRAGALDEAVRTASWPLFEAVASLSDHRKPAAQAITARLAEILSADEHVIALKSALDEQQVKALRLLTEVPPSQQPPTPNTKEGPGVVVAKEDKAADLDSESARSVLAGISRELDQDTDLRLSIAWMIVRKGKARSQEAGSWPETVAVRDRAFRLKWCDSPLRPPGGSRGARHDPLDILRELRLVCRLSWRSGRGEALEACLLSTISGRRGRGPCGTP
jgi:hypothetical protein